MTAYPVLTMIHVAMGSVALIAGAGAMSFRKGSRRHRQAGNVFFVSMLIMSALGAFMASVKPDMGTTLSGTFTFYLVATAWMTVIRKEGQTGAFEVAAMAFATLLAVAALAFGLEAADSPNGRLSGYPATFYYVIAGTFAVLAIFDARLLIRGGIAGARRLVRHLWRMGFAFFVAAGSLFLGQPDVFPEPIRGIGIRSLPVVLMIGLVLYWLIRVSLTGWYRRRWVVAHEPGIHQGIG